MIPAHISYSQWKSYTDCPRSWYLNKIQGAEEKQTWFLPIGTAVHTLIEERLKHVETYSRPEDIFYSLISAQMKVEPDTSKWLAGGSKDNPVVEDKALLQVERCFEAALEFLEDVDVWHVELDISGELPGLEVPIKAFADLIGEHKKQGPFIGDWKTGKSKPKDNFQLETYVALRKASRGIANYKGWFIMVNPDASNARPVDLSEVDPAAVGAKYQKAYEGMRDKIYKTNAGYGCRFCFHQDNCLLQSGPTQRAKYYDKAHEDGYPF
jgi:RecB family exonuclease